MTGLCLGIRGPAYPGKPPANIGRHIATYEDLSPTGAPDSTADASSDVPARVNVEDPLTEIYY